MEKFDLIVIGSGSGLDVAVAAAEHGLRVALVEEGPMGGTCLNRGCIPSKILIHSADVMQEIKRANLFGINVGSVSVDFKKVMERTKRVGEEAAEIESNIFKSKIFTLYKERAQFTGKKKLLVKSGEITADKIVIAAGTRPFIPKIEGLDKIRYMTSDDALRVEKLPKKLIIAGGGYIAAELAHFFGSLGSEITILQRNARLLPASDEEVSQKFTELFSNQYDVRLKFELVKVEKKGNEIICYGGDGSQVRGTDLLIATGRIPNTDILSVAKTGVKLDPRGFVQADEYMETNVKGIWALGDIAGRYLFKHSANLEAQFAFNNLMHPEKRKKIDYRGMPYGVFTYPQVAGAGVTEQELKAGGAHYIVGRYKYSNTAMGRVMEEKDGFVKFLTDHNGIILGCHIIGPGATTLIHEVLLSMRAGRSHVGDIVRTIHIHPSLSEVVQRAAGSI